MLVKILSIGIVLDSNSKHIFKKFHSNQTSIQEFVVPKVRTPPPGGPDNHTSKDLSQ